MFPLETRSSPAVPSGCCSCQYFCCFGYGWYFYITWLPTYLAQAHGADLKDSALLAWAPRLLTGHVSGDIILKVQVAALGRDPLCSLAGSPASSPVGWPLRSRNAGSPSSASAAGSPLSAYWGAAALLLLSALIKDPVWAMFAMGMASFSR